MDKTREHTDREKAWLAAWCAVVTNRHPDYAAKFADQCLKEFDERFNKDAQ